jgi:hypothetical protein
VHHSNGNFDVQRLCLDLARARMSQCFTAFNIQCSFQGADALELGMQPHLLHHPCSVWALSVHHRKTCSVMLEAECARVHRLRCSAQRGVLPANRNSSVFLHKQLLPGCQGAFQTGSIHPFKQRHTICLTRQSRMSSMSAMFPHSGYRLWSHEQFDFVMCCPRSQCCRLRIWCKQEYTPAARPQESQAAGALQGCEGSPQDACG